MTDYKKFDQAIVKEELGNELNNKIHNYATLEKIFISALDKHFAFKKNLLRANQTPFMSKTMRTSILRRSQLQKKYFNSIQDGHFRGFSRMGGGQNPSPPP